MNDRPPIPLEVKREVRRACKFGCVICGMPVFDYDHIEDFADVRHHDVGNLVLLCPTHHRAKTSGHLSRKTVREARLNPFNSGRPHTTSYGLQAAKHMTAFLGSNFVTGPEKVPEHHVIWINGVSFLTIHYESGTYTYSAIVTDDVGKLLIHIDHGELVVATDVWDYRYEGRTVSVRRAQGDIIFEAEVTDAVFAVRRAAFVDKFETGVVVQPNGVVVFTMSRMEIGSFVQSTFLGNANGAIALKRGSCFADDPPYGFGIFRGWQPEYEQKAVELQAKFKRGEPGNYPPGLEHFKPYP